MIEIFKKGDKNTDDNTDNSNGNPLRPMQTVPNSDMKPKKSILNSKAN